MDDKKAAPKTPTALEDTLAILEDAQRRLANEAIDEALRYQEKADERRRILARTRAERGELAMVRMEYTQAATYFNDACAILSEKDNELRLDLGRRYAQAMAKYYKSVPGCREGNQ